MPIAAGATAVYYASPWNPFLILGLVFAVVGFIVFCGLFLLAIYFRSKKLTPVSAFYCLVLIAILAVISIFELKLILSLPDKGPYLVIHPDYIACGSWSDNGRYMRVPWRSFTGIERSSSWTRMRTVLVFHLNTTHIPDAPWNDWVASRGVVNCNVSWLTNDPHSYQLWADTQDMLRLATATRRSAILRAPAKSYQELMQSGR
jgi:hypothetical protein